MLTKSIARTLVAASILGVFILSAGLALAQGTDTTSPTPGAEPPKVTFPIPELGGCDSKEACRAYCEIETNREACVAYAEKHGLMKKDEAQKARQFIKMKGPGGCTSPQECRAFCEAEENRDECYAYAKERGLVSEEKRKLIDLLQSSGGPGGCRNPEECRAYCSDTAHREECKKFAEDNDLPPAPKMKMMEKREGGPNEQLRGKIDGILETKPGPGGCASVSECKTYCADTTHAEECLKFAEENGLMTRDETKKAGQVIKEVGPGGCKGVACKEYCADEAHAEECLTFAQSRGLMSSDQARAVRTILIGGGPGGCKGPEKCREYCSSEEHADECAAFAQQNGMMQQKEMRPFNENDRPNIQIDRPMPPKDPTNAGVSMTLEERCAKAGGTWDGTTCTGAKAPANRPAPGMGAPDGLRPQSGTAPVAPEERCAKAGGTWDGTKCSLPSGAIPKPPMGTAPTPEQMQERCAAAGGTWDGTRCMKPQPPIQQGGMKKPPMDRPQPPAVGPASSLYSPFVAAVASLFVPFFR